MQEVAHSSCFRSHFLKHPKIRFLGSTLSSAIAAEFLAEFKNAPSFYIWSPWEAQKAFKVGKIGLLLAKEVLTEFLSKQARRAKNSRRTFLASKSPILRFPNDSHVFQEPQIQKEFHFHDQWIKFDWQMAKSQNLLFQKSVTFNSLSDPDKYRVLFDQCIV